MLLLAICVLVAAFEAAASTPMPEPCENYHTLDQVRSTGYVVEYPEEPLCDDGLQRGWYRFSSRAGGDMPTHRVAKKHCGTVVPIWLNGTLPTVEEGIVSRPACANFERGGAQNSNGCEQQVAIGVKNCGAFYVYYLHPTPACPIAYCAGSRVPCPAGKWAPGEMFPTNLRDCRDSYPKMTTPPKMTGPIVDRNNARFYFQCQVQYTPQHADQEFEVVWMFQGGRGGDQELAPVVFSDPTRTAILDGAKLKGHLGKSVGCKVRGRYKSNPNHESSPWLESSTYWAGVRPENYDMEVSEKEEFRNLTLTSTIPMMCKQEDVDNGVCCLLIRLNVEGGPAKLDTGVACKWPLCGSMWDGTKASLNVPIMASKDDVDQGTTNRLITFQNLKAPDGLGPYPDVFNDHQIDSVQVRVRDEDTKTCTVVSDPHLTGFTGKKFNIWKVGDFTLFENTERNFEVQIRTWPCWGGRATCICGVAVREKSDLLKVDGCSHSYYQRGQASPEFKPVGPLRLGTSVQHSSDGSTVVLHLPSGAEVKVVGHNGGRNIYHYLDVTLKVPAVDKDKGKGLCGTFDDNANNEWTRRNGHEDRMTCNSHGSSCEPLPLINSWNNTRDSSLFNVRIPFDRDPLDDIRKFCQCDKQHTRVYCSTRPQDTLPCAPNCEELNQGGRCMAGQDCDGDNDPHGEDDPFDFMRDKFHESPQRRRRAATIPVPAGLDEDDTSDDFDPFTPEMQSFVPSAMTWQTTPRTITEAEGRATCTQRLHGAPVWPHCQDKMAAKADDFIDACLSDVEIGDSFDAVDSMVDSFTTACQLEMAKFNDSYSTDPSTGKSVLSPAITTDVCPTKCTEHGHCDRGQCVCHEGFMGDNCQLKKGQPPVLDKIRGSNLCDLVARPCRKVFLDAAFIQRNKTFACKIKEQMLDGTIVAQTWMFDAEFITASKMACPLPPASRSVHKWVVSTTVDGSTYSNSLTLTVFDSTCRDCSTDTCQQLPSTCLINDQCHQDRDINTSDHGLMCEVASNPAQWTRLYPSVNATLSGPDGEGNMVCRVETGDLNPLARYKIAWAVDGQPLPNSVEKEMPVGTMEDAYPRARIAATGNLTCKVRSFYSDRSVDSPARESNSLDLSQSLPYPSFSVHLSGPNANGAMVCTIQPDAQTANAGYKVSWYVDGAPYPRERELTVSQGKLQATYSLSDLPPSGELMCKMRSYFSGENVFSPKIASNAVNL